MYVRPYLEDPLFLQPDDGEVSLLHPDLAKASSKAEAPRVSHHDLITDPDLEYDGQNKIDSNMLPKVPGWIVNFRHNLMRTKKLTSNEAQNPSGFRYAGEKCNHNYECISGKCLGWLHKAPICMPF